MATTVGRAPEYSFHIVADDIIPIGPAAGDGPADWSRAADVPRSLDVPGIASLVAQEMHGARRITASADVEALLRRGGFGWGGATPPGHMRVVAPPAVLLLHV